MERTTTRRWKESVTVEDVKAMVLLTAFPGVILIAVGITCRNGFDWDWIIVGGIVGGGTALVWILALRYMFRDTLVEETVRVAEGVTGQDLDGDGQVGDEPPDFDRLHDVAKLILRRVANGQDAKRETVVDKLHLCTQPEWNAVNAGCKKIGLRHGYVWSVSSVRDAWDKWQRNTKVMHGRLYASDGRNWTLIHPSPTG